MGRFIYEEHSRLDVDDRTLAHLHLAMLTKLRRRESFTFTWSNDVRDGGGRTSVWVHPASSLVFRFSHRHAIDDISSQWVHDLVAGANSAEGMRLLPESAA